MAGWKPSYITEAQLGFERIVLGLVGEGHRIIIVDNIHSFINEMGYTVYLTCDKHKTYAEVCRLSGGLDEISHADILAAAGKCAGCITERAAIMPPTRWPEGAEL